jgi:hypothetical protein
MRDGPGTTWPAVPRQVADQIRPLVNDLAEQMVTEISAAVTEYARLSDPVYARNLRLGAETAVAGFADRIARPHAPRQRLADTFCRIGKVEAAEGRSLEMLQAALRAGARVVIGSHDASESGGVVAHLPGDVLVDLDRARPCLIVPDPEGPGRRRLLDQALTGVRAAAGPAVPVTAAASSLAWAAETLALRSAGGPGGHQVLHCDDHLTEIVLHRGHDALARLSRVRLAPLSRVAAPRRKALADTLLAWLETRSIGQTAARLHIHRQTARYRMNQLQAMFGPALDDPDVRFELELALRARRR